MSVWTLFVLFVAPVTSLMVLADVLNHFLSRDRLISLCLLVIFAPFVLMAQSCSSIFEQIEFSLVFYALCLSVVWCFLASGALGLWVVWCATR